MGIKIQKKTVSNYELNFNVTTAFLIFLRKKTAFTLGFCDIFFSIFDFWFKFLFKFS